LSTAHPGFTQGTGQLDTVTTTTATLTGLAPNTLYDAYILNDCSARQVTESICMDRPDYLPRPFMYCSVNTFDLKVLKVLMQVAQQI
jgi:HD superfamily phosphohydrolase